MVFRKQGLPDINELVVCTVKKVLPHSVFAELDEYYKEGMIHISEIAPGRIRNMRDHVVEGRKIVCKILSINEEKGHINLSLRRVNQSQKINKMQEFKQETKAQRILENTLKPMKEEEILKKVVEKIFAKYHSLTECFYDIINNKVKLLDLKIEASLASKITKAIEEKIKLPEVVIKTKLTLECFKSDGISRIKKILVDILKVSPEVSCLYLGAPTYQIEIKSKDYRQAENNLKEITQITEKLSKQLECKHIFKRQDK